MPRTTRTKTKPHKAAAPLPGDATARRQLARMLRVNQAGEYGAQRIYAGQLAVLGHDAEISHMAAQEDVHLDTFNALLVAERVRPTLLQPVWHMAGFALGVLTAAMGREAAMACTVAVEEVIVEHYEKQIAPLQKMRPDLAKVVRKFQAEEDEHRAIGVANDAEQAPAYPLLRRAIRKASQTAIWLSERV
jgi:ubiquinone biosynthesis monooxygenase Coq7